MRPSTLERVARAHRAAVARNDRAARLRLQAAWRTALTAINAEIAAVQRAMTADINNGLELRVWLAERERRLTRLRAVVTEETRAAAGASSRLATQAQRQAITLGQAHSGVYLDLFNADVVAGGVFTPDLRAIEQLVGNLPDGSPLNDLFQRMGPDTAKHVTDTLIAGVGAGHGPRQIATDMRRTARLPRVRAEAIARTEALRVYRDTSFAGYRANPRIVQGWVWWAAIDTRTCPACWAMHGTWHPMTEELAAHINCRCTPLPMTQPRSELGVTERSPGVDGIETGEARFAALTEAEQRDVLGPGRHDIYQAGQARLIDMVDRRPSPIWGDAVQPRTLTALARNPRSGRARRIGGAFAA